MLALDTNLLVRLFVNDDVHDLRQGLIRNVFIDSGVVQVVEAVMERWPGVVRVPTSSQRYRPARAETLRRSHILIPFQARIIGIKPSRVTAISPAVPNIVPSCRVVSHTPTVVRGERV